MFEALLGVLTPIVDPTSRFALEQLFPRGVQFLAEIRDLDRIQYAYRARRIYCILVKVAITGDADIRLVSAADSNGDGLVFFPAIFEPYSLRGTASSCGPNVLSPKTSSISFDDVATSETGFTLFVATDQPVPIAHIDVCYTVMDRRQTARRALIRLPLRRND